MSKTVLIVDDDKSLRKALEAKVSKKGYATLVAENGQDALRIALEKRPDIIILDLVMPVMDGKDMLAQLRQNDWGATVPVVILSNVTDDKSIYETTSLASKNPQEKLNNYFIKSDTSLESIIEDIEEKLKDSQPSAPEGPL